VGVDFLLWFEQNILIVVACAMVLAAALVMLAWLVLHVHKEVSPVIDLFRRPARKPPPKDQKSTVKSKSTDPDGWIL
jgi:hypothetical protein